MFVLDGNTPTPSELVDMSETSWLWLVDAERACSLLVGRCLGGMLAGQRTSDLEVMCAHWLRHNLLSNGLELNVGTDSGNALMFRNISAYLLYSCSYHSVRSHFLGP